MIKAVWLAARVLLIKDNGFVFVHLFLKLAFNLLILISDGKQLLVTEEIYEALLINRKKQGIPITSG
jgi:hypothetical protein